MLLTSAFSKTEFRYFFRGVGLGVYTVQYCHPKVRIKETGQCMVRVSMPVYPANHQ